ncbi:MAG: phage major capsid protein, partial [Candidatus Competibacteraceae bacterium]|nr:phage major capsid protein [Candidatus Competibacteraceae bacterium]
IQALPTASPMRGIASGYATDKRSVIFLVDTSDAGAGWTGGATWVGEGTARPETASPTFAELEIPVHEVYAMPKASQNLLDDSSINIEDWLAAKASDSFAALERVAFISGNGVAARAAS